MKKSFVIMLFVLAGCSAAPKVQKKPMRIFHSAQEFMEQFGGACTDLGNSCMANTVLFGCPVRVEANISIVERASYIEAYLDGNKKTPKEQILSCFEQAQSLIPAGVKVNDDSSPTRRSKYWLQPTNHQAIWVVGNIVGEDNDIFIRMEYKEFSPEQQLQLRQQ